MDEGDEEVIGGESTGFRIEQLRCDGRKGGGGGEGGVPDGQVAEECWGKGRLAR